MSTDSPVVVSAWAPLRINAFRMLFIAMVVSNIGTWMQMVGAQWLLIDEPNATTLIAFIQTAMTLPLALFAIPSGIISDAVDRRRMLAVVQGTQTAVAAVLALLVLLHVIHPVVLLLLLFALGVGTAFTMVPVQSAIVELVPREQMPQAAVMTGLSTNIARAVGPALAGALVAAFGTGLVFALNVLCVAFYFVTILRWKHDESGRTRNREPFLHAFRSGVRYVANSPHLRRLLLRVLWFTIPSQAIWALLPLVARRQLGLDVGQYGLLLAAIGVGAVGAAVMIPHMRRRWRTNGAIGVSMLAYAISVAGIAFTRTLGQSLPLLLLAGFGWIGTLSTITGSVQMYLPGWVRSRGGSMNTLAIFLGQAVGAAVWGWLADRLSLQATYAISAAIIGAAAAVTFLRPLRDVEGLDRTPAVYWPEIDIALDPLSQGGTVLVTIEYDVPESNVDEFVEAIAYVRLVRTRTGGYDWQLQRDIENPRRFIELYTARSWEDHMRQHEVRLTESDRQREDRVASLSAAPPRVQHFLRTWVQRL